VLISVFSLLFILTNIFRFCYTNYFGESYSEFSRSLSQEVFLVFPIVSRFLNLVAYPKRLFRLCNRVVLRFSLITASLRSFQVIIGTLRVYLHQ